MVATRALRRVRADAPLRVAGNVLTYFHEMTLFRRMVVLGAVILLFVAATAMYATGEAVRSLERRIATERLVATEAASLTIEDMVVHAAHDLRQMGQAVREGRPLPTDDPTRRPISLVDAPFEAIGIVRRSGEVVSTNRPDLSKDLGIAALGLETWKDQDVLFSAGFRSALTGAPLVGIGVPGDLEGDGQTLVLGLIRMDSIPVQNLLTTITDYLNTGHAELLDSRSFVLAATDTEHVLGAGDHPSFNFKARSAGRNVVETVAYEEDPGHGEAGEEDHVMAYAALSSAPWALSVGGSESETFAPARDFEHRIRLITGFTMALGMLIGLVGAARLSRPVQVLSGAARRMAAGDLNTRVSISEGGEIAGLAEDMEHMRARLSASLQEIQDLNRTLESRISERTAELERRNRELTSAAEIAAKVTGSVELWGVLEATVDSVASATLQRSIAIFLMDKDGRHMRLMAGRGLRHPMEAGGTCIALGQCLCGKVATSGKMAVTLNLGSDQPSRFLPCAVAGFKGVASFPLPSSDRVEGVLAIFSDHPTTLSSRDFTVVTLICHQVGLAIHNARLFSEAREKALLARQLFEKALGAQEEERKRLARELHDDTGQSLTGIALSLEAVMAKLPETNRDGRVQLEEIRQMTLGALAELRKMMLALRPSALDDLGLVLGVRRYALQYLESHSIAVDVEAGDAEIELDPAIETVLFRITQEAVNNVARHSKATRVVIRFSQPDGETRVEVEDNGVGFDPEAARPSDTTSGGLGLSGMYERAGLVGGSVTIQSAPGSGTRVIIRIPVARKVVAS